MKILIIRTFPDKLNLNSYNVQEVGLAKALVKKGHTCDIVLYNGKDKDWIQDYIFSSEGQEYGFKIYWMHGYGILKNGFMPSVKKIIPQYDVIQVHEYDQIMSWNLYTKQIKPTVIYHGPYFDEFAKGYNLRCKMVDTFFLPTRKYKDVVAISKSTLATEFLHMKGFQNVTTAGVGINLENFGDKATEDVYAEANKNSKQLLYVGKLEERRNLYFLVDVFRKLQKQNSEIKFMIIGNGEKEYKEKFLEFIKEEIENGSIVYHEKAPQTELVKYYQEASFFMLASRYEIFGMVLLEAMYFGSPVISSVNGGSCTLIQNGYNGFVMEDFNSDKWADCIWDSMQNESVLEEMKLNAKKTIVEKYTWDALADVFINAYDKAIEKGLEFKKLDAKL